MSYSEFTFPNGLAKFTALYCMDKRIAISCAVGLRSAGLRAQLVRLTEPHVVIERLAVTNMAFEFLRNNQDNRLPVHAATCNGLYVFGRFGGERLDIVYSPEKGDYCMFTFHLFAFNADDVVFFYEI